MLQNLEKCSAYILIDFEYLRKKINESYDFYSDLYPNKRFEKFDIAKLLSCFAATSHIMNDGDVINVVFLYRLGNSDIPHSLGPQDVWKYNNIENCVQLLNDKQGWVMNLYSFFSDPEGDESSYEYEFNQYVQEVATDRNAFTIVLCKDGNDCNQLNYYLSRIEKSIDKKFYIFRDIDAEIGIDQYSEKFSYVTLDYAIALCMGLKQSEW